MMEVPREENATLAVAFYQKSFDLGPLLSSLPVDLTLREMAGDHRLKCHGQFYGVGGDPNSSFFLYIH